jgi:uncharacterized protein (UPF0264 family)
VSRNEVERDVPLGDFRRIVLTETRRLLVEARRAAEIGAGQGYVKRDPTPLIRHHTNHEIFSEIRETGAAAAAEFPQLRPIAARSEQIAERATAAADPLSLLAAYSELMALHGVRGDEQEEDNFQLEPLDAAVRIQAKRIGDDAMGIPAWALACEREDQAFIVATANMIAAARSKGRGLSRDEQAAVALAYRLLDRGVRLPPGFRSIGVYGFRDHQTSLSLANPGEGHIAVTCADASLLKGTIVHIEHIDRDGVKDREKIEPYRLPAALNAARVRLHAAGAVPCTAYIGRPIFENGVALRSGTAIYRPVGFGLDLLKTVHSVASACTAMFMNGVADCKIAIERTSFSQSVELMRAVAGNVVRDPARQYLSAAFNINLPVWDDRLGSGSLVSDPLAVARLGIEIAVEGRFEKVTWDGATNQVPSLPVIEQLPSTAWVALVHEAHERGLETYLSAGMSANHMRPCVWTGVDGVGIGTSLHHRDPATGAIGQLNPEAVREVLKVRDDAASEPLGRAARALARLDRLFFEGTLPTRLEPVRRELFAVLRDGAADRVDETLRKIDFETAARTEEHPLISQAKRVLETAQQEPIGAHRLGADLWRAKVALTNKLLETRDVAGLRELLA